MSGESNFIVDVDINSDDAATYVWYIFHCSFATATVTITSGNKLHLCPWKTVERNFE